MKIYLSIFLFVLFLCLLWFSIGIYFPLDFDSEGFFSIEKGEHLREISLNLEEQGIIRSSYLFRLLTLISGKQSKIMAGNYAFTSPISINRVLNDITTGNGNRQKTVIFEGWNLRDIASSFQTEDLFEITGYPGQITSSFDFEFDFLKEKPKNISLEGFLFPDSYEFSKEDSLKEIVFKMLENFSLKTKKFRKEAEKQDKSFFDVLVMASLLEREVKPIEDKKIVAGILWKRLKNGWPLQVDACLTYLTGNPACNGDKEIDSKYNTYKYRGLPLGPICNPGLESIEAALYYEDSPYWFYLSAKTGETIFSKTLEEHNLNRYKYLR